MAKHYHQAKMLWMQQQVVQEMNRLTEARNKLKPLITKLNLVIEAKPRNEENQEFEEESQLEAYAETLIKEFKEVFPEAKIPNVTE